ncbi:hypothetical protein V5N11_017169 [Cardamine amara subsp. amara]|uniref:Uncharacterized protein n=1 Tax=Cardamine amara subsp. amara TaxID=228776 RepID=A0ABD0Z5X0_CARAN
MANCRSRPPWVGKLSRVEVSENSVLRSKPHGSWECPKQFIYSHLSSSMKQQRGSWTTSRSHSDYGDGGFVAAEEAELVAVLREAHPYVNLHRDSKFVVMLSAELLDSCPTLDGILKVITI